MADKDSDLAIIRDLNNQVTSYKRKYESAKTELRNLKGEFVLDCSSKAASRLLFCGSRADNLYRERCSHVSIIRVTA